jgi:hypothetical protein
MAAYTPGIMGLLASVDPNNLSGAFSTVSGFAENIAVNNIIRGISLAGGSAIVSQLFGAAANFGIPTSLLTAPLREILSVFPDVSSVINSVMQGGYALLPTAGIIGTAIEIIDNLGPSAQQASEALVRRTSVMKSVQSAAPALVAPPATTSSTPVTSGTTTSSGPLTAAERAELEANQQSLLNRNIALANSSDEDAPEQPNPDDENTNIMNQLKIAETKTAAPADSFDSNTIIPALQFGTGA